MINSYDENGKRHGKWVEETQIFNSFGYYKKDKKVGYWISKNKENNREYKQFYVGNLVTKSSYIETKNRIPIYIEYYYPLTINSKEYVVHIEEYIL